MTAATHDPTTDYARKVSQGKVLANRFVKRTCARHLDDLKARKQKRLVWSLKHANTAIEFFPEFLCLAEGR